MNSTPLIHSIQLRRAREAIALSAEEVARQLPIDAEVLQQWEAGESEPPLDSLESLAAIYGRSIDYFLTEREEQPKQVFFRTTRFSTTSQLSLEARQVVALFEELCRFESELEGLAGIETQQTFITFSNGHSGGQLAEIERKALGLGHKPIRKLRELLSKIGVRVFVLAVPASEFSGLSWWHADYGPAVLVNGLESPGRRSFTMAHEFGHLVNKNTSAMTVCDLSDIESERKANRFAVEFHMPEEDVKEHWNSLPLPDELVDAQMLGRVAQRYSVSLEALAIRLEEFGLLPSARWVVDSAPKPRSFGRRRPDWRRTRGEHFVSTAKAAHKRGRLSLGKLAEYLGTDIKTAMKLATDQE